MRVVIGTLGLASPGGTETYCLTVARELDRLGHDVTLFADQLGPFAEWAREAGFDIAGGLGDLPATCDVVLANDAVTAGLLAERYPETRLVFCIHTTIFEVQSPPLAPGLVNAIVASSERFAAFARAFALDVPVVRLSQPIDTEYFAPSVPPREIPRRALLLGNYLDGRRRDALVETWTARGVECVQVGLDNLVFDVRAAIADADIVVARGRAAMEGMACGKAVYVFDAGGGDGWVTMDAFEAIEADNFAGMATDMPVDRQRLAADLDRYDSDMGWINRELVVTHHNVRTHAQRLVEVLRGPAPERREPTSSSSAAARTVRFAWRAQMRAMNIEREVAEMHRRLHASEVETLLARAERDAALAERDAARKLLESRRVRAGLVVGRYLDRARGRR